MIWNKTIPGPGGERWFWPAWGVAFVGFPIGGSAAYLLLGPVEAVGAAAMGGAVTGAAIGAAQWLVLRRRLPLSALWVAATAAGMAVGMTLGQVLLGDDTATAAAAPARTCSPGQLSASRRLSCCAASCRRRSIWAAVVTVGWALAWAVTAAFGVDLARKWAVFGSSGALVFQLVTGLTLAYLLAQAARTRAPAHERRPVASGQRQLAISCRFRIRATPTCGSARIDGAFRARSPGLRVRAHPRDDRCPKGTRTWNTPTRPDGRQDGAGHRWHRRHRQGDRAGAGRDGRPRRDHRPRPRARRGRGREIRAAGGGAGGRVRRGPVSQAEVRRLADEVRSASAAARRAGQQRRRLLEHPARHRRRARAHLRPQPSRAVPAHQPAPRPAQAERPGPGGHRLLQRAGAWGASTSTTSRANGPTPARGPTTSPSSPTSCSPTSWPGGCRAPASPPTRCIPAWCAPRSGPRTPAGVQRLLVPFLRPFMKTPAQGAATSIHLASAPDLERVTGRYFANSKPKRSSTRSYDEAAAARLWQVSADLVGLTAAG